MCYPLISGSNRELACSSRNSADTSGRPFRNRDNILDDIPFIDYYYFLVYFFPFQFCFFWIFFSNDFFLIISLLLLFLPFSVFLFFYIFLLFSVFHFFLFVSPIFSFFSCTSFPICSLYLTVNY